MNMTIFCPATSWPDEAVESWRRTTREQVPIVVNSSMEGDEAGYLSKVQAFYEGTAADVIAYLHSDLITHETDWHKRVLEEFSDPTVGVVGFVGATRLGHPDLYRVPYDFRQLARADVWSNLTDAEVHGGRDAGSRDVAVLDSCALIVRRSLLVQAGGWPLACYPNSTHCTDLWLCAVARRLGQRVRLVGVAASHAGGGKGEAGTRWLAGRDHVMHQAAHRITAEMFRDVLPIVVKEEVPWST